MPKQEMLFDGDTFEHKGRTFLVEFPYDETSGPPWEDCDGHGIVSDWTTRDKKPGEKILATDRSSRRYYDYAETIKIALRDGWDAEPYKTGTKRQQAERAVNADYEHLRRWCNDQWQYVGVVVKHEDSGESESLWGIESDSTDYLAETAHELADDICFRLDEAMAQEIRESRPDMYGKESAS